jgi:hypothetical protein
MHAHIYDIRCCCDMLVMTACALLTEQYFFLLFVRGGGEGEAYTVHLYKVHVIHKLC